MVRRAGTDAWLGLADPLQLDGLPGFAAAGEPRPDGAVFFGVANYYAVLLSFASNSRAAVAARSEPRSDTPESSTSLAALGPGGAGQISALSTDATGGSLSTFDVTPQSPAAVAPSSTSAAAGTVDVSPSGNPYVDGVLAGVKWDGPITYSFPDAPGDYADPYTGGDLEPTDPGFQQVSQQQMQAVRHFFEGIAGGPGSTYDPVEGFTNLSLTELPVGSGGADVMIAQSPDANPTSYSYYPATDAAGGDVWFGNNFSYRNPLLGSYEYLTHLHETGHALGLKHGNETDVFGALPADRDDLEFSVMTYRSYLNGPTNGSFSNEQYGYPQTYMMSDVAALQFLYGADYTYNSSTTIYRWSETTGELFVNNVGQGAPGNAIGGIANRVFETIWDGGGTDTYDMSNYTGGVTIDLRAGQWSLTATDQRANLGNNHFAQGTVYNAYEFNNNPASLIENATGGSGGDYLFGNETANTLTGNAADDTMTGNAGNDTIYGGAGNDIAAFGGPRSGYAVSTASDGSIIVSDRAGADGVDTIYDVEQFKFTDRATPYTADELLATEPNGGRWILSTSGSPIVLGINNGVAPVFPAPQTGAFNIEVFTNPNSSGVPNPDAEFQSSIADAGGTLDNGFLTGTALRLGSGDLLVVDSVTGAANQSASTITLGTGNQTVVGVQRDTILGNPNVISAAQVLSGLAGFETVMGGAASAESIWGGANDSIVGGSSPNEQIVITGSGTTVQSGSSGNATISAAAQNTIIGLGGSQENLVIAAGINNVIDLNSSLGLAGVIGASGDTIAGGAGTTNIEGAAGGMLIAVGAGGTTNLSGSTNLAAGNTVNGGAGEFNFNPGAAVGKGDLIDLSSSAGTATVNAFAFQTTRVASPDTILGTNNADSVFGGDGDRIGTGSGTVVGGTHQWTHADTVAGSAVGFGSNDTVSSTTYIGISAVRGTVPGTSSAQVTVGGFNSTTDFIFYQNESSGTNSAIVATTQSTTIDGIGSSIITLPDGTVMTLVGISQLQLQDALVAGTLFRA